MKGSLHAITPADLAGVCHAEGGEGLLDLVGKADHEELR